MLVKGTWFTIRQSRDWLEKNGFKRSYIWLRMMVDKEKVAAEKEGGMWWIEIKTLKRVLKNPPKFKVLVKAIALCFLFSAGIAHADMMNLDSIRKIESQDGKYVLNPEEGAYGPFQIRIKALRDFRHETGSKWKLHDMYNEAKAAHVAIWYLEVRIPALLKAWGHADTLENRIVAWNCGITCVGDIIPPGTKRYIRDYKSLQNKKAAFNGSQKNS